MWGGLKTESGKFHEILTSVCGGSKDFLYPPKIVSVCVWEGGLKTQSAKFHEILTSVLGGLKTFLYPPKIVSMCGGV